PDRRAGTCIRTNPWATFTMSSYDCCNTNVSCVLASNRPRGIVAGPLPVSKTPPSNQDVGAGSLCQRPSVNHAAPDTETKSQPETGFQSQIVLSRYRL